MAEAPQAPIEAPQAAPITPASAPQTETSLPRPDAASARVVNDPRIRDGIIPAGTPDREKAIYEEILEEQRATIGRLTNEDPKVRHLVRDRKWVGKSDMGASRIIPYFVSPDDPVVREARARHAQQVWGQFAEQSPATAEMFAAQDPEARAAITAYRDQELARAQTSVRRTIEPLINADPQVIDARDTQAQWLIDGAIQDAQARYVDQGWNQYVASHPDTARFLADSGVNKSITEAYARFETQQETAASKAALAAKAAVAAQEGPGAGLDTVASGNPNPTVEPKKSIDQAIINASHQLAVAESNLERAILSNALPRIAGLQEAVREAKSGISSALKERDDAKLARLMESARGPVATPEQPPLTPIKDGIELTPPATEPTVEPAIETPAPSTTTSSRTG